MSAAATEKHPLLLYVPGLLPKPEPAVHRDALFRCLLAGLRTAAPETAAAVGSNARHFDLIAWTWDFYRQHRDIALDSTAIDALLAKGGADARDRAEAGSWRRRALRRLFALGDIVPFLVPHLATERQALHLRDLRRYVRDVNGIGEHTREQLKTRLRAAARAGQPVLLIAHSMGSVIAWDSLWQLSHDARDPLSVDWLTMGSPLGQRLVQKGLLGNDRAGDDRFPTNVDSWTNLAAVGDLTAIDPVLADDFAAMRVAGSAGGIDDRLLYNGFRLDGGLNPHAEYGYLASEVTGGVVADWWRRVGNG